MVPAIRVVPGKHTSQPWHHLVTGGLPNIFGTTGERMVYMEAKSRDQQGCEGPCQPGAHNYPLGIKDVTAGPVPVVWTNTNYKMLYLNMGHGDKIFTSPLQNRLIENGLHRLLGKGTEANPAADLAR